MSTILSYNEVSAIIDNPRIVTLNMKEYIFLKNCDEMGAITSNEISSAYKELIKSYDEYDELLESIRKLTSAEKKITLINSITSVSFISFLACTGIMRYFYG